MQKIVILLTIYFICVLAWLPEERQEELKKYSSECSTDIGLTIENVQLALIGEADEAEKKVKCFAACILKKIEIMNKNGTLNEKIIRQVAPKSVPKEELDDVINKCLKIEEDNDCEKATKFLECVIKTTAALKLIVS